MKIDTAVRWIAVVALCAAGALCEAKELQWQEGKVTAIVEERNIRLYGHGTEYDKGVTYTVEGTASTYVATETAGFVTSKLAPKRAAEHDVVKFALQGDGVLIMVGKDGKEHRMMLRSSEKRKP